MNTSVQNVEQQTVQRPTDTAPPQPTEIEPQTERFDWLFVDHDVGPKNTTPGRNDPALMMVIRAKNEIAAGVATLRARDQSKVLFPYIIVARMWREDFLTEWCRADGVKHPEPSDDYCPCVETDTGDCGSERGDRDARFREAGEADYGWHVLLANEGLYVSPDGSLVLRPRFFQSDGEQSLGTRVLAAIRTHRDKNDGDYPSAGLIDQWLAQWGAVAPTPAKALVTIPATVPASPEKRTRKVTKIELAEAVKLVYDRAKRRGETLNQREIRSRVRAAGGTGNDGKISLAWKSYVEDEEARATD